MRCVHHPTRASSLHVCMLCCRLQHCEHGTAADNPSLHPAALPPCSNLVGVLGEAVAAAYTWTRLQSAASLLPQRTDRTPRPTVRVSACSSRSKRHSQLAAADAPLLRTKSAPLEVGQELVRTVVRTRVLLTSNGLSTPSLKFAFWDALAVRPRAHACYCPNAAAASCYASYTRHSLCWCSACTHTHTPQRRTVGV
jgi:hypothetical protein